MRQSPTTIKGRLLKGWAATPNGYVFKVHLDGYNLLPYLEVQEAPSPRRNFFYFDDDEQLVAMRHDNWKFVCCEQRAPGNLNIWEEPFICPRPPKIYNLRMDPYERADITSDQYNDWLVKNVYLNVEGNILSTEFIETFKEYPPSQAPASFTVDPEAILTMLQRQRAAVLGKAGLIDSHVHVVHSAALDDDAIGAHPEILAAYRVQVPRADLALGFTSIVDLDVAQIDQAWFEGTPLHPRFYSCGRGIRVAGGYMAFNVPPPSSPNFPNMVYESEEAEHWPQSLFPVWSELKDDRQVRSEIHALFPSVTIKFNFEQRCRSRSGCENSTFNYFL